MPLGGEEEKERPGAARGTREPTPIAGLAGQTSRGDAAACASHGRPLLSSGAGSSSRPSSCLRAAPSQLAVTVDTTSCSLCTSVQSFPPPGQGRADQHPWEEGARKRGLSRCQTPRLDPTSLLLAHRKRRTRLVSSRHKARLLPCASPSVAGGAVKVTNREGLQQSVLSQRHSCFTVFRLHLFLGFMP